MTARSLTASRVQAGCATWQGHEMMRISVSSFSTGEDDDRSLRDGIHIDVQAACVARRASE